ncbi:Holliday junction resolvase [Escherichia coli]|uniref:Holliday junction resolvase n=1 Tax=Escherichia coli TaxID=562 RepID=A0A2X3JKJ1_ECOLX|nr:Holliday junction resolvase [Escherichia coli]
MTERIEFVLPYPPTVNTYWRRRGSTYFVSKAGERYRRDVALIVRQQRLKLNPVRKAGDKDYCRATG